ncbi:hypothetical protein J6590_013279 [Homalodisca vitripennis]|nr:hypothetical protein J6590_013279 [Homalodisca vitripennis]
MDSVKSKSGVIGGRGGTEAQSRATCGASVAIVREEAGFSGRFIVYFVPGRRSLNLNVGRDLCQRSQVAGTPIALMVPHTTPCYWPINAAFLYLDPEIAVGK